MRRLFWMTVGAAGGIYVLRKATAAVNTMGQAVSPSGVASAASVIAEAVRDFAEDVRSTAAEREYDLRLSLGIEPDHDGPARPVAGAEHGIIVRNEA